MAGLVPAIGRGTLPLHMAGTSPAMTIRAGFIQGTECRWELAMTGNPPFTQLPYQLSATTFAIAAAAM
jgi:hypothetical protein